MKISFSLVLILCTCLVYGQYDPLQSAGKIPKDFITPSHVKYKKELKNVDRRAKRKEKRDQKEFFLESSFGIDDLLKSGMVLFNDPVSKYVNDVAAELLKDEPALKRKLRFYVVATPSVNAFATNQGVIFINMGLLAQLENEAQLAFILAHEITHYTKEHTLKFYLEKKQIDRDSRRGYFKRSELDETLAKNNFSKEQETEADALGLNMFLESDYDFDAIQGAFDVLQFSYLPFDNIAFNKSYFEDEYLIFDKEYQLDTITAITLEEDDDDSKSTHPSLPKRRQAVEDALEGLSNDGKSNFIISENRFFELQETARYELLNYYLRNHAYYHAIYSAFMMQKQKPNDIYFKNVIAKSLYGITKYSNAQRFSEIKLYTKEIEGEFSSLVHFVNEMSMIERNTLAMRYIYNQKDQFKDDESYQEMVEDIAQEMMEHFGDDIDKFVIGKPKVDSDENEIQEEETSVEKEEDEKSSKKKSSKYDKLRKKKKSKETKKAKELEGHFYAFGDLLEEEDFKKLIKQSKKDAKEEINAEKKYQKNKDKINKYYGKGNYALGEKKVLVLNPFYLKLTKNFENPMLIQSELGQQEYVQRLKDNAKLLGLKLVFLDPNTFKAGDVEKFNDFRILQNWLGHHVAMENDNMQAYNQNEVDEIFKKYGVDDVLWTGLVTGTKRRSFIIGFVKLIFPISMAETMYSWFVPKGESAMFSLVLNGENGKARMSTFDSFKYVDNKDIVNQRVYDTLWQIVKKRKK